MSGDVQEAHRGSWQQGVVFWGLPLGTSSEDCQTRPLFWGQPAKPLGKC